MNPHVEALLETLLRSNNVKYKSHPNDLKLLSGTVVCVCDSTLKHGLFETGVTVINAQKIPQGFFVLCYQYDKE